MPKNKCISVSIFFVFIFSNCQPNPKLDTKDLIGQFLFFRSTYNQVKLRGTAAKGTIKNAQVTAIPMTTKGLCDPKGKVLGQGTTDLNGNYNITITDPGTPVCILVTPHKTLKTTMFDEKTRKDLPWTDSSSSYSVVIKDAAKQTKKANITAFSKIAARRMQELAKNNTSLDKLDSIVTNGNKEVTIRFALNKPFSTGKKFAFRKNYKKSLMKGAKVDSENYPELTDIDVDLTNPKDKTALTFNLLLSGMSELANKTANSSGKVASTDLDEVVNAFSEDMADGKFDGKGVDGKKITISGGSTTITLTKNSLTDVLLPSVVNYVKEGGDDLFGIDIDPASIDDAIDFVDTAGIEYDDGSGSDGSDPNTPLTNFSYPDSPFSLRTELENPYYYSPTLDGGTPTSCSSVPALPSGLAFDINTNFAFDFYDCSIYGVPLSTQSQTSYVVTAKNNVSTVTTNISITVTAPSFSQQAFIKPPNPDASDNFGYSVDLDFDTAAIGAIGESSSVSLITNGSTAGSNNSLSSSGAVYVFSSDASGNWSTQAYIKAPDTIRSGNNFGYSVTISDTYLAAGSPFEDSDDLITDISDPMNLPVSTTTNSPDSGAVYVLAYDETSETWDYDINGFIKADNAYIYSTGTPQFGYSIDMDAYAFEGPTLVVGSPFEDSNQTTITNGTTASTNISAADAGAAYVYLRDPITGWDQEAYIKAPNANAGDRFGISVSVSEDTIVVGAPREASNQATITNGSTASANNSNTNSGAAYVFVRDASGSWTQQAYLKTPFPDTNDLFGTSVAIDADTIAVGAPGESSFQTTITNGTTASSDNSVSQSGAVYVYKRTGTTWAQEAYIKPSNTTSTEVFGSSVSLYGDSLVVGAVGDKSNSTSVVNGTTSSANTSLSIAGAVFVYRRSTNIWAQKAYLKPPFIASNFNFGNSVSISGDTVVVGAKGESSNQTFITNGTTSSSNTSLTNAGAGYIFVKK